MWDQTSSCPKDYCKHDAQTIENTEDNVVYQNASRKIPSIDLKFHTTEPTVIIGITAIECFHWSGHTIPRGFRFRKRSSP